MGTVPSITVVRRDGKLIQKKGGFTESQTRKAKFLGKKPEELTEKEMQTPLTYYVKQEQIKNARKK